MASSISMGLKVAIVIMVLCMVAGALPLALAQANITCAQVTTSLTPCVSYLTGGEGNDVPPPDCCSGIESLNATAASTEDRQQVCNCLKSAAGGIDGLNFDLAAGLPDKCGVDIPYEISPSVDCKDVK